MKCTVRDPEMAVPYTGKEENIHFAVLVLRRIRKQKGRAISRKKTNKQVAIKVSITVLLLFMRIGTLYYNDYLKTPPLSRILKFKKG